MNRGGNMKSIIRILIFTILIVALSASTVCADRIDTGWKGYGLYNLNNSDVTILNESNKVTVNGSNVTAVYEYTIRNNASNSITVNFGYPDNGIYKFSVHDGSKFLSYKTRLTDFLKTNYGAEGLQTPDGRWFLFNMAFTPGQTRTIKVSIDADMKKAENDTYGLSFFKDRSYKYAIAGEKVQLDIEFAGFRPYMIFDLDGIKPEEISEQGTIAKSGYGSGLSMNYQPVDKMAIERLSASEYKKPKAIVKAFNEKKYNDVLTLCDEYINAPSDSRLSLEQVKYVKAEANRLLNNNQEYITAIEQLDISKLYPGRIRYKVLLDRLEAYKGLNNSEAIDNILKELIPETQQGYPYLNYWLGRSGFELTEEKKEPELPVITGNTETTKKGFGLDILDAALKIMTAVRDNHWTYAFLGLLVGFIAGRLSKKGKKRKSVYLFRD
jgi:hypothetical protein